MKFLNFTVIFFSIYGSSAMIHQDGEDEEFNLQSNQIQHLGSLNVEKSFKEISNDLEEINKKRVQRNGGKGSFFWTRCITSLGKMTFPVPIRGRQNDPPSKCHRACRQAYKEKGIKQKIVIKECNGGNLHPTRAPTPAPTPAPTISPTLAPTIPPTPAPTNPPTPAPTNPPTPAPTNPPTPAPTNPPTPAPTLPPTPAPTLPPTPAPTISPTLAPTIPPTPAPTNPPTPAPTNPPTPAPTIPPTPAPTNPPTPAPTIPPTPAPTLPPTLAPTNPPTPAPTIPPTPAPTNPPTDLPTIGPYFNCLVNLNHGNYIYYGSGIIFDGTARNCYKFAGHHIHVAPYQDNCSQAKFNFDAGKLFFITQKSSDSPIGVQYLNGDKCPGGNRAPTTGELIINVWDSDKTEIEVKESPMCHYIMTVNRPPCKLEW